MIPKLRIATVHTVSRILKFQQLILKTIHITLLFFTTTMYGILIKSHFTQTEPRRQRAGKTCVSKYSSRQPYPQLELSDSIVYLLHRLPRSKTNFVNQFSILIFNHLFALDQFRYKLQYFI